MLSPDSIRLGVVVDAREVGKVVQSIALERDSQLVVQLPRRRPPYAYATHVSSTVHCVAAQESHEPIWPNSSRSSSLASG